MKLISNETQMDLLNAMPIAGPHNLHKAVKLELLTLFLELADATSTLDEMRHIDHAFEVIDSMLYDVVFNPYVDYEWEKTWCKWFNQLYKVLKNDTADIIAKYGCTAYGEIGPSLEVGKLYNSYNCK